LIAGNIDKRKVQAEANSAAAQQRCSNYLKASLKRTDRQFDVPAADDQHPPLVLLSEEVRSL
jgi:hypothetical protein